ncbi:ankyrin repeat protein SKIP35 isoform X2 [Dendrobium catenatum]|uniref:ankyrin repeat protein SKIP35 isoform X2 n=1 Tax=Dendrobium catenatum TaxID=906689 RepID=UPI0010A07F4A|nr:ankyrin repeat protein SKIP35 isoform X2 [Dendrobium catenatum]
MRNCYYLPKFEQVSMIGAIEVGGKNMQMTKKRSLNDREGSNASLMGDRIEQCLMFHAAMRSQDWEIAESLFLSAEPEIRNDFLCKAVEFVWFLKSRHELDEITRLIKMIVSNGAGNLKKALVKSSFLAACLSVFGSLTMSLKSNPAIMIRRLIERFQKSNQDEVFKAQADGNSQKININDVRLQILGFKAFLNIAGSNLSRNDFLEAFEVACFPLTHIQNFYPGWEFGGGAYLLVSLLTMLVEGGANNVNQSLLEATQFGSTELLAQQKNLPVNVDLALEYASQFVKIRTMECLVVEGKATSFLKPLISAARQGCLPVLQWFVNRGCPNIHLVFALAVAASNNHVQIATYLLHHIPLPVLTSKGKKIIKITYDLGGGGGGGASLQGVSLLLQLNFLGDSVATYAVADKIARSEDGNLAHLLKVFLQEQWSEAAFWEGMKAGKNHYVNLMRILRRGESSIWLRGLPSPLLMAIGYMPLYKDCVKANGRLLPQRLRGQLVEIAERITNGAVNKESQLNEVMGVLEHHIPLFVRSS